MREKEITFAGFTLQQLLVFVKLVRNLFYTRKGEADLPIHILHQLT